MDIRFHETVVRSLTDEIKKAAYETMNDIRRDVDEAQTVPMRDGTLNDSAFVEFSNNSVELHYSTPYALAQYYIPMNHYTGQHANATDHWLDCYIPKTGSKSEFIGERIVHNLRKNNM